MKRMMLIAALAALTQSACAFEDAFKPGEFFVNFNLAALVHRSLANTVEGDFSNELWRIYAWAGREAGIQPLVTCASTHLVVTEHPVDATKSLVCALNTNADTEEYEIKVNGMVGKVWNGSYANGKLKVRHNDGCIFEVTK